MEHECLYMSDDSTESSSIIEEEEIISLDVEECSKSDSESIVDEENFVLESEEQLKEIPIVLEIPVDIPGMTNSQVKRVNESVKVLCEFKEHDELTNSQTVKRQIHLENLLQVRKTILQMIDVYLDDPIVSENLLSLMDSINGALPFDTEEEIKKEEIEEEIDEESKIRGEFKNVLHLIQNRFVESENPSPDSVYPLGLHQDFVKQIEKRYRVGGFIIESNVPEIVKNRSRFSVVRELPEDGRMRNLVPLRDFPKEPLECTLRRLYTKTEYIFYVLPYKPMAILHYVEVTVSKKYRSFTNPFVIALREKTNNIFDIDMNMISLLKPIGCAIFSKSNNLIQYVTSPKELSEGDTVGFGITPGEGNTYNVMMAINGKWIGWANFMPEYKVHKEEQEIFNIETYELILITGSAFNTPQLDITINSGKNPFQYTFKPTIEDCSICYCDVPEYSIIITGNCQHRFCDSCVIAYLQTALNDGKVLNTTCPFLNCKELLSDHLIEKLLSPLEFGKFIQYRTLASLRLEPNCRWCPNQECDGGVIGDPMKSNEPLICNQCNTKFCFNCSQIWHPKYTCSENARRIRKIAGKEARRREKEDEKQMEKYLKDNKSIKCARCSALIQRNDGCNHITCRCGHEFCWLCGETVYISIEDTPLHYLTGACAGLQMSSKNELSRTRNVIRKVISPVRFGLTLPVTAVFTIHESIQDLKSPKK